MNPALLLDPLFAGPFLTGLMFAMLLPLLGCYLRLRGEWLAALAFAQTAAAGSLLAMLAGLPMVFGGLAAAGLAGSLKHAFDGSSHTTQGAAYGLLLLLGWAASVLMVSNLPLAERIGQALFDGQLYFTDQSHLISAAALALASLFVMRLLSQRLLLAHFFPDFLRARGLSGRRAQIGFDLLVAGALALATMSLGVMGAFALIFVPPLVAFGWGGGWRQCLLLATATGVAIYVLAFALALSLDQPFSPLCGLLLVAFAVLSGVLRRLSAGR
jgi:zinc/manganese transport system permease protein